MTDTERLDWLARNASSVEWEGDETDPGDPGVRAWWRIQAGDPPAVYGAYDLRDAIDWAMERASTLVASATIDPVGPTVRPVDAAG